MIQDFLSFVAKTVGAGSRPGNGRNEWLVAFLVLVIGMTIGLILYAMST